ncbi:hypothetical protein TNCV_775471 [Trichonephila clavipes]|uniref:Uncharacterized protein n=1 Tax=Trichonephila clavipes TaxID=2585209 RepID=A0A8X6S8B9_TRICX|nr:hypothetical protein TNCV_775471 [Trichonephila clavipes]
MSHQEKKRKHINSLQSLNDAIHWSPSTIREPGHHVAPTGGEQVADACCLTSELGYFYSKTSPMPRDEASVVICSSAFGSGSAKTGGFNMASLISSNASCVSDVHSNGVSFLKDSLMEVLVLRNF